MFSLMLYRKKSFIKSLTPVKLIIFLNSGTEIALFQKYARDILIAGPIYCSLSNTLPKWYITRLSFKSLKISSKNQCGLNIYLPPQWVDILGQGKLNIFLKSKYKCLSEYKKCIICHNSFSQFGKMCMVAKRVINQQKKSQDIWVLTLDLPITFSVILVNQPSFLDIICQIYKIGVLDLTLSLSPPIISLSVFSHN